MPNTHPNQKSTPNSDQTQDQNNPDPPSEQQNTSSVIKGDYGQNVKLPVENTNPIDTTKKDLGNGFLSKAWPKSDGGYGLFYQPKGVAHYGDYPHQTEFRDQNDNLKPQEGPYTNPHNSWAKLDEYGNSITKTDANGNPKIHQESGQPRLQAEHQSIKHPVLNGGFWLQPDCSDQLDSSQNSPDPQEKASNVNSQLQGFQNGKVEPGRTIPDSEYQRRQDLMNRLGIQTPSHETLPPTIAEREQPKNVPNLADKYHKDNSDLAQHDSFENNESRKY